VFSEVIPEHRLKLDDVFSSANELSWTVASSCDGNNTIIRCSHRAPPTSLSHVVGKDTARSANLGVDSIILSFLFGESVPHFSYANLSGLNLLIQWNLSAKLSMLEIKPTARTNVFLVC